MPPSGIAAARGRPTRPLAEPTSPDAWVGRTPRSGDERGGLLQAPQKTKFSPVFPRRGPTLQRHARRITSTAIADGDATPRGCRAVHRGGTRRRFVGREDAERFVEEVRGDDPDLARYLRIEERELVGHAPRASEDLERLCAGDLELHVSDVQRDRSCQERCDVRAEGWEVTRTSVIEPTRPGDYTVAISEIRWRPWARRRPGETHRKGGACAALGTSRCWRQSPVWL